MKYTYKVLWVDDEIGLLKPHILFLNSKGFEVIAKKGGAEALEEIEKQYFDAVLLDENMPGISGLETLNEIKAFQPHLPIIMITKTDGDILMEEAIGMKIADFLVKPIKPSQVLASLKRHLSHSDLVTDRITQDYQKDFRAISIDIMSANSIKSWSDLYIKLVNWEIQLENIEDRSVLEILESQKREANNEFFKFVSKNYEDWINNVNTEQVLSHNVFKKYVVPELQSNKDMLLVMIDNFRLDQWKSLESNILALKKSYKKKSEKSYFSILPTATQYARNTFFSGMTPLEISKKHKELWVDENEEGGKNQFEEKLLAIQLKKLNLPISYKYHKIIASSQAKKVVDSLKSHQHKLSVVVYNFIDMLSHSKTNMEIIKELASNDKSYRSLTKSWFENSALLEVIQIAMDNDIKIVITTDHGTINVKTPSKIIGPKETSTNLRYKKGIDLSFDKKDVYYAENPVAIKLPKSQMRTNFIFAKNNLFFAYQNNYNYFSNYYKDTYQHGGISMEEMIIPFIVLDSV